jgi:dTDP-glucose pyrophosphorylase
MQTNKKKEILVTPDVTLLEGMKKMDTIRRKLLLVYDGKKYIGLISIGDIQRAIINSIDLNSPVSALIRKDNIIAHPETSIDEIKKLMLTIRAEFMPVVSNKNELLNVYFWEDLFAQNEKMPVKQFNLPVVIMAGGIGTRLKPLTNILPKPLIPIGEKTIIEQIMDKFCEAGCNTFYLSVSYKAEMIKYYFSTLPETPYHISYLHEEKPLGTAGSLHLLRGKINSTFFVSNCDILIDQDISDIYDYHKAAMNEITLVAALKNFFIPYGILETSDNGLLQSITEKPEITFKINTGLYILEPHLLDEIPENKFYHITTLINTLKKKNRKVGVFPVSEKSWKDIGDWSEYQKLIK